jgi:hypothetical protein
MLEMRAVAAMKVIDAKRLHGIGERSAYAPKRDEEYLRIAAETGISAREIYTMFVSPEMLGEPV